MDLGIKSTIERLKNQQHRIKQAIELLEHLDVLLADSVFFSEVDTAKPNKKKHWTQRPGGKAKLSKAMKKTWKSRKRNG